MHSSKLLFLHDLPFSHVLELRFLSLLISGLPLTRSSEGTVVLIEVEHLCLRLQTKPCQCFQKTQVTNLHAFNRAVTETLLCVYFSCRKLTLQLNKIE